jgi:hypothetical protein
MIEKHTCTEGLTDLLEHSGPYGLKSRVIRGKGHAYPRKVALELRDTGNGYIAKWPATSSATQDYYVCLDYSQARDLVLALSAFKKDLGFKP